MPDVGETLEALAVRVEQATGLDRELDLAIHLLLADGDGSVARLIAFAERGLNQRIGRSWELKAKAVHYETWNENQCWANGSIPVAQYTASLDAAMSLVPEGWEPSLETDLGGTHNDLFWQWTLGHDSFDAVHGEGRHGGAALTAAALRARAALTEGSQP
jgi:hypothetical protein